MLQVKLLRQGLILRRDRYQLVVWINAIHELLVRSLWVS